MHTPTECKEIIESNMSGWQLNFLVWIIGAMQAVRTDGHVVNARCTGCDTLAWTSSVNCIVLCYYPEHLYLIYSKTLLREPDNHIEYLKQMEPLFLTASVVCCTSVLYSSPAIRYYFFEKKKNILLLALHWGLNATLNLRQYNRRY